MVIPNHLKQYVVNQDYEKYSYIDQATWRFIMKISTDFFKRNADEIYFEGLKKTGITLNKIPRIESIDQKLSNFGWRAVCVRGFIPPNAFMEFQSLKILPIAADMRSHKNITYTPSPDIAHEAAGHAPIIANKDYSEYLINYGEIASKAIISSEDLEVYYAIRNLSDIKENIYAEKKEIKKAKIKLEKANKSITYLSESAILARMNWWTVEYGLIGEINNPKIYGAGLLSSVAESENCLKKEVKKIPFSIDCINFDYDITEQQPQLFVTPNYKFLSKELKKLAESMAFNKGGEYGLNVAKKAKTLCTVVVDDKIYISGIVKKYIANQKKQIIFISFDGPTQIGTNKKQLNNHGPDYHLKGFSSPLGNLKKIGKPISKLSNIELTKSNIIKNKSVKLEFEGEIVLSGKIISILKNNSKIIIITFENCILKYKNKTLFEPELGNFDLVCGSTVTSVFGGVCDPSKYFSKIPIDKKKYEKLNLNDEKKIDHTLNNFFKKIKESSKPTVDIDELEKIYNDINSKGIDDWLLKFEFLHVTNCNLEIKWIKSIFDDLYNFSIEDNDLSRAIRRALNSFN